MRNLKRALSLTLASVMLLGMMVVGSSAAGYPDVSEEENIEAIEVLQAVGVMGGDENGNFNPDDYVTREQMAVIMAQLLKLDYNYYKGTNPFSDVPEWAAPYVAACAANGVTAGIGGGLYGSKQNIQAVQAALMMLKALGYFQYAGDYGDSYVLATVKQGTEIGLFDGIDSNADSALTRNQVAQMALNALKANMVSFTGDPGIEYTGTNGEKWVGGYKAEYTFRSGTDRKYFAISSQGNTTDGTTNQAYIQLGEELYDGDLRLRDNDTDAFGRPARYWEYDGKEIGTYAKKELLKQEYTTKVTGKDLYELIGKGTIDDKGYDFYISVDGETEKDVLNSVTSTVKDQYFFDRTNLLRTNTNQVGGTGNGVLTQVFVDNDNKDIYIAIINTYLAKATGDYNARKDEVTFEVWNLEEYGTTGKLVKDGTQNTPVKVSGEDFDIKDVKDGDIVKVTVAEGEIKSIDDVDIIDEATITSFKNNSYLVTGGTQYNYATTARYDNEALVEYVADGGNMKDTSYRVYLDQYGYVIGVEIIDATANYLFLTGINSDTTNLSDVTARGNVIFLDGKIATVDINMVKSENAEGNRFTDGDDDHGCTLTSGVYVSDGDGTGVSSLMNTWCTYTVSDDGVYTLKEVANNAATFTSGKAGQNHQFEAIHTDAVNKKYSEHDTGIRDTSNTTDVDQDANDKLFEINKTHVRLNGIPNTGYQTVSGNDNSVYMSAETSIITARKTLNTGTDVNGDPQNEDAPAVIISGVDAISTGVQQTNIEVRNAMAVVEAGGAKYTGRDPMLEDVSSGAYTLFDKNGYVIAAIVLGDDQSTSTQYAWVVDSEVTEEGYENGKWSWRRGVIIDGRLTELNESNDDNSAPEIRKDRNLEQGVRWWEVKTYADGSVKEVTSLVYASDDSGDFKNQSTSKYVKDIRYVEDNTNKTVILLQDLTGQANKISVKGNTLQIETSQSGYAESFSVDYGARVAVVQDEEILKNGQSLNPREFNYKDDVETFVNTRESSLKDALGALNDNNNFKGWLAAVFDSDGVATSVIFYDLTETKVNTSTEINLGSDLSVTELPEGTLNVTSTKSLSAKEVASAISTFLNDDEVVKVEYNATTKEAIVTYDDGDTVTYKVKRSTVADEGKVAGAELLGKVQADIGDTSKTGRTIRVDGNKITTIPGDKTASGTYVTQAGVGMNAPATQDLAELLVGLHDKGAREIECGGKTYVWGGKMETGSPTHLTRSQWILEGHEDETTTTNSLVTALAGTPSGIITQQVATLKTNNRAGTASATLMVDGVEIVIAIDLDFTT